MTTTTKVVNGKKYNIEQLGSYDRFKVGEGEWNAKGCDDTPGHRETFIWYGFETKDEAEAFVKEVVGVLFIDGSGWAFKSEPEGEK